MSYSFNNIPLSQYGIIPAQVPGSNIAIAGQLDMPARIGKTHEVWDDVEGVEPYVAEGEIFLGGRDIIFHGLVQGESREDCLNQLHEFYGDLADITDLVPFSSDFGSWMVYVKEAIVGEYVGNGWATIKITFRQPEV